MRPVTKTGQGTYAPVVDVSSQVALDTSLAAFTIPFGSKSVARIREVWNTGTPTAKQVLDGLLLVVNPPPAPPAPPKPPKKKPKVIPLIDRVKAVKDTLVRKLGKTYGTASGPLEDQLGRFCSFCEHYYQSGLGVEHIVPKAPYPLFYLAWDNFLLACPPCNSNKTSKPPRNDAMFTPKPTEEIGYFTKIKDEYLWPQWYSDVFTKTKPVLELKWQGNWYVVDHPVQAQTELISADKATRTIKADVYADGSTGAQWWMNVEVRVLVTSTSPGSTAMVNQVALNKESSNEKKPGGEADIRLWSRTEHWFKVLDTLQTVEAVTDPTTFDLLWKMMMKSVQQPGLYSVWVTVMDLLGPNGSWVVPGTTTSVMSKFLAEIVGQDYFPGTDTANTPN